MPSILFLPLNQNHVLIFDAIRKGLRTDYEVLCHDRVSEGKQYHTEEALKRLDMPYRHFPETIDVSPRDRLLPRIRRFFQMRRQIRTVLEEGRPQLVVMAIDNDPICQILISESRKRGIKTVLVPEGLLKRETLLDKEVDRTDWAYNVLRKVGIFVKYVPYGTGGCDLVLVSGKRSAEVLGMLGVDERQSVIVGQQKYDAFLERVRDYKPDRRDPKVVLYAASTRIFQESGEVRLVRRLIACAEELGVELNVKLHPRTPESEAECLELLGVGRESPVRIIKEGYDTFDLLTGVDVVVTIASAIVLEALMMDKECIAASYLAGKRRFEYDAYDAMFTIEEEGNTLHTMKECLVRGKSAENKKRLLEDELYRLDGRAVERTTKEIERMLETENRAR